MSKQVSIIIVNWNSAAYLRPCLSSIYRNAADSSDVEVIVIDNASFDGSGDLVAREFPQTVFLQSSGNIGFAAANNRAAAEARGDRLLFLNPDTEIVGYAVPHMAQVFDQRPDAGAVGCRLLNTDGSLQTSCIQPFPTILNQALMTRAVVEAASRAGLWGLGPLYKKQEGIYAVQALSGACLMVSRAAFRRVGGFSTDYFMYTEDIDLCYKIRQAGFVNYYTNSASVVHHGGGSSKQRSESSFANVQMRESIYKFLRKTRGRLYAATYRSAMCAVAVARIGVLSVLSCAGTLSGSSERFRHALSTWLRVLRWSLAKEKWTR